MQAEEFGRRAQEAIASEPDFYRDIVPSSSCDVKFLQELENYLHERMQEALLPSIMRHVSGLEVLVKIYLEQKESRVPEATPLYILAAFYLALRNGELHYRDVLYLLRNYLRVTPLPFALTKELVSYVNYLLARIARDNSCNRDTAQYITAVEEALRNISGMVRDIAKSYQCLLYIFENPFDVKKFEEGSERLGEGYDVEDENNRSYVHSSLCLPRLRTRMPVIPILPDISMQPPSHYIMPDVSPFRGQQAFPLPVRPEETVPVQPFTFPPRPLPRRVDMTQFDMLSCSSSSSSSAPDTSDTD